MKILVTGCTSRQANPKASVKDVSFAHLVAEALRQRGHDVEHRNPSLTEDVTVFDRVIVGIAPLHALGSNRAYGALSAIMRTWGSDKLIMMIDDPDTGKIFSGIRTMVENPERLTKPFFVYKLEYEQASSPEWKSWLNEGVKILRDNPWPPVIVPQHSWAGTPRLTGAGSQLPEIVGIDPTSLALREYETPNLSLERRSVWTVEAPAKEPWLDSVKHFIAHPIDRHGAGGLPRFQNDKSRMQNYATVRGVLYPPVLGGDWWNPRPALGTKCGALVLTNWQAVRALGEPWTLTPEQADQLRGADLERVIREQYMALDGAVPTPDAVGKALEDVR